MKSIDQQKPVLVTGGTGYLASWIIKQLLDEGKTVHTTVRDLSDEQKYAHLTDMAATGKGILKFFEADLLKKGSFQEAMKDCELIIHTASPFKISGLKDAQKELIDPALEGTRNVLESVNATECVKRVVLTSSVAAIYGDAIDIQKIEKGVFTEQHWNFSSTVRHQPYSYSKTLAEKLAWEMAGQQNRWDLLTINPGFIMGPSLSKRTDSTSIGILQQVANGKYKSGVPAGKMAFVDVRDAAKAHILAGFTPGASGRHICISEHKTFLEMANVIRDKYPKYPLPKGFVPKWLFWLFAPAIGFTREYVKRNVGIDLNFDNSYIQKDLSINFIQFEKTIIDHFEQLVNDGLIIKI